MQKHKLQCSARACSVFSCLLVAEEVGCVVTFRAFEIIDFSSFEKVSPVSPGSN